MAGSAICCAAVDSVCVVGASAARIQLDKLIAHCCSVGPRVVGQVSAQGYKRLQMIRSKVSKCLDQPRCVCRFADSSRWIVGDRNEGRE